MLLLHIHEMYTFHTVQNDERKELERADKQNVQQLYKQASK